MNLFLDSNALIKLYHDEVGSDSLQRFIGKKDRDLVLTIADISKLEFTSAILKRVRQGEISLKIAKDIHSFFENDLYLFNIVSVGDEVKLLAGDLLLKVAHRKALGTLDSLQLSTAFVAHRVLPIDWFITSDKPLLNIAREYFPVFNPEVPD